MITRRSICLLPCNQHECFPACQRCSCTKHPRVPGDRRVPRARTRPAGDSGPAALFFTLTGNGGPTGADNGGFYPSTAFGRLFAGAPTLLDSTVHVADLGQAPTDGFTEYQGFPGPTRPRWGDYSAGVFDPASGKIFFATSYIQDPSCTGSAFALTLATCGGTRDAMANWGTSVNSVSP
jgi:hypothetical protein